MKPDKKRFLFTGIGLGILFATLVLQAAAHFPQSEPLTRERVESWAKEHGYALVNPDEIGKEAADSSVSPETKVVRETITSIYIVPGMKSQDVERLLVEAGLLEETNDFQEPYAPRSAGKTDSGRFVFL